MTPMRLPVQLTLIVILVQAIALALLLWNSGRQFGDSHQEALLSHAQAQIELLSQVIRSSIQQRETKQLLDSLDALRNDENISYAAVFSNTRVPLAVLGNVPPLRQPAVGDLQRLEYQDSGILSIEQPIKQGESVVGLLQIGYNTGRIRTLNTQSALQNTLIAGLALLLTIGGVLLISTPLGRGLNRLSRGLAQLRQNPEYRFPAARDVIAPYTRQLNDVIGIYQTQRLEMRTQYDQIVQGSRRLNSLLSGINAVVWEVDPSYGRFVYVSDNVVQLTGHLANQWLMDDFCQRYVHPSDIEWLKGFLTHTGNTAETYNLDFRLFNHVGDTLWVRMISTIEMRDGGPVLAGLLLNVTEEKRSEQRITYLADHDPLTGLINRRRFQEKLEEQIAYNRRYQVVGALLFMDLDQFKYINDTYGHKTGDEYLRQVSHHLRNALRKTDTVGRLGGDEFGVILPKADQEQAEKVCDGLLRYLNSREFIHDGRRTPFTASLGVALFPTHSDNASDLLAKADSAMYNAKEQGRNTFRVFNEGIDASRMRDKIHWEARIRQALSDNRFQLFFQPIVDIHNGNISHYESLLRMVGEGGEIIPPGAFIGIAERFGLIREIDHWVVSNALRTQGKSETLGKPVCLTVNLSGRHLGSPEILEVIQESAKQSRSNPNRIVFEVTETAAVENFTAACELIGSLRKLGYRFALDDFGAGFSSFDYLKHLSVDYVKIDGSFVRNLAKDRTDRIFVNAINEMAKGLGVKTIAEFVENAEIVSVLRELDVPLGQGYFFAKPSPRFHEHGRIIFSIPETATPVAAPAATSSNAGR